METVFQGPVAIMDIQQ